MYANTAHAAYAQNNIGIESPKKLVQMLYEGVLRFNLQAKRSIEANDIEKRGYWINRSCAIFGELINTLDMSQGDISQYLNGLYSYQLQLLSKANFENSAAPLSEVNDVVKGLLEAWREVNTTEQ
jgi:flagellar protein FliS